MRYVSKAQNIVDYGNAIEVYVDGVAVIVDNGPCSRLTFTALHTIVGEAGAGTTERRVIVELIMPTAMRAELAHLLTAPRAVPLAEVDFDYPEDMTVN
jgi:hypothetical protein